MAGVLFLVGAVAQVVLLRRAPLEVLMSPVPVSALAGDIGWLVGLLDVRIAASFFACVTGSVNALARVLFSMGREGVLPAALGRVHARRGTPVQALSLCLPLVVGVPFVALLAGSPGRSVLTGTITVSAFGYVLVCAAVPLFLRRIGELTVWPVVGGLVASGLWLLVLLVALGGESWQGGRAMSWVYLAVLLPGAAWAVWLALRRPSRLARVGVYDEPAVASVLPGSMAA
ncbi:amino acid permease [Modestobacter sp. VKM Ac-2984]|uniref:amino acid permease n=1 Tax=Modestobacter sp. VKM Ac-2984 TaxID=3004138 RepID=UPI0022AA47A0|nr:amino acid permease [Modestobacter sp. VKM Ac-2984]MCZ2817921.1 amino acid permease [Modestobacter sp. VKM Ac-2984]